MLTFEMKVMIILSFIFAARIYQLAASELCLTGTSYGLVRGFSMTSHNGRDFCAFLGIPFAAPPIGTLRFMPPVSPQPWKGVKDCIKESKECIQKETDGSEDCLYLNVFTRSTLPNGSLPVMVFIHGGGFFMGSSTLSWFGPEYLMDKDIVLVTIQYRLGPFGFLSTEDEVVPGNMGLKDQVRALQWVQENIQSFGGNKFKVTIFGNSAGSASVHYHMLSPGSKSLFTRAISQSGTADSSFALIGKGKAKNDTRKLAVELNCSVDSSVITRNCLQNRTSSDILRVFLRHRKSRYGISNKIFRPVVEVNTEHAFLTETPGKLTTDKPWLVGLNSKEGLWRIDHAINQTIKYIQTDFKNWYPLITYFADLYTNMDEMSNLIYKFYFEPAASEEDIISSIEQLTTDTWFAWPTERAITRHNGTLYYYLYDHEAEYSYSQMYQLRPLRRGVGHTDELLMLFTQKGTFPFLSGKDLQISKLMVELWTNFATWGNPTPNLTNSNPQDENSERVAWKESQTFDPTYLHIETDKLAMKSKLFVERMKFWESVNLKNVE